MLCFCRKTSPVSHRGNQGYHNFHRHFSCAVAWLFDQIVPHAAIPALLSNPDFSKHNWLLHLQSEKGFLPPQSVGNSTAKVVVADTPDMVTEKEHVMITVFFSTEKCERGRILRVKSSLIYRCDSLGWLISHYHLPSGILVLRNIVLAPFTNSGFDQI